MSTRSGVSSNFTKSLYSVVDWLDEFEIDLGLVFNDRAISWVEWRIPAISDSLAFPSLMFPSNRLDFGIGKHEDFFILRRNDFLKKYFARKHLS